MKTFDRIFTLVVLCFCVAIFSMIVWMFQAAPKAIHDADECPAEFKGLLYKTHLHSEVAEAAKWIDAHSCFSPRKKRELRRVRDIPQAWDGLVLRIGCEFYEETGVDPNTAPKGVILDWIIAHPDQFFAIVEMILRLVLQFDSDGELLLPSGLAQGEGA